MKNAYAERGAARRYDSARALASETTTLWLETLKAVIRAREVGSVLDLGCGTGRFTSALGEAYGCPVVGAHRHQRRGFSEWARTSPALRQLADAGHAGL